MKTYSSPPNPHQKKKIPSHHGSILGIWRRYLVIQKQSLAVQKSLFKCKAQRIWRSTWNAKIGETYPPCTVKLNHSYFADKKRKLFFWSIIIFFWLANIIKLAKMMTISEGYFSGIHEQNICHVTIQKHLQKQELYLLTLENKINYQFKSTLKLPQKHYKMVYKTWIFQQ